MLSSQRIKSKTKLNGAVMKRLNIVAVAVLLVFLSLVVCFAQKNDPQQSKTKYAVIEANYLEGLKSNNMGLRISCAYFLGELKSRKAVVPLMKMLSNEEHEGARIMAAWSLIKIGDPKGIILVRQNSENCDCTSVKCWCDYLYKHYVMHQEGKLFFD